jgi:hypothetical protein
VENTTSKKGEGEVSSRDRGIETKWTEWIAAEFCGEGIA